MSKLSHLDEAGRATMVAIAEKPVTHRKAVAKAVVTMSPQTLAMILDGQVPKGDVLAVARVAGIMAAKKTADLIPLCHPISLSRVAVTFASDGEQGTLTVTAEAEVNAQTGVEMEALTAVSVAALTIYDMVKSAERGMTIGPIKLLSKEGGASGSFRVEGGRAPGAAATKRSSPKGTNSSNRPVKPSALRPRTIMDETGAPRPKQSASARRDAMRSFMAENRLQATSWAKAAGVAPGTLYSFLHGRTLRLAADDEMKLAKAARVALEDIFGQ